MNSYLRPAALHVGPEVGDLLGAGRAVPVLGGALACSLAERIDWAPGQARRSAWVDATAVDWPAALTTARPTPFDRPCLMGILNVTPDSFSDGGRHDAADAAIEHGLRLAADGASIVDVGGESTRPGATPVPLEEELRRVVPVVRALAERGVLVSVDTRKAKVMAAAVAAGAAIINDVSGLTHDPAAMGVAAEAGAFVVLMHMAGEPATMNLAPSYEQCALEVFDWLAKRVAACSAAGVNRSRLIVDPGLCFGKHEPDNLDLMHHFALFHGLGCPVMLGASRKGWTAAIEDGWPSGERLPATLAAAQWALAQGIQLLRVHDVAAHRQLLTAWTALADQRA
ncbi:MAG: dihydropteroate synthase [Geminicoccaceae bacterium]